MRPGPLVQIEILVSDIARSLIFYREVFGWEEVPAEMHDYKVLDVGPEPEFGVALRPLTTSREGPSRVILYFAAEDPETVAALAVRHGGKNLFGPYSLPSYGQIWHIEDPDGQRWGLFRAAGSEKDPA